MLVDDAKVLLILELVVELLLWLDEAAETAVDEETTLVEVETIDVVAEVLLATSELVVLVEIIGVVLVNDVIMLVEELMTVETVVLLDEADVDVVTPVLVVEAYMLLLAATEELDNGLVLLSDFPVEIELLVV